MHPPPQFATTVDRAVADDDCGLLRLLSSEAEGFSWAEEGHRLIVEAQKGAACDRTRVRTIVFSGHMVDEPDRPEPRFPSDAVPRAAELIRATIRSIQRRGLIRVAVAGAASGGDILFLEAAQAMGIPTRILLPGPSEEFISRSVAPAGPDWISRFDRVCARSTPRILHDRIELPEWLTPGIDYSVWERNNRWILATALEAGGADTTLVVLWDQQPGDGRGGTAHMVEQARAQGAEVVGIDPRGDGVG